MFVCLECGNIFHDFVQWQEKHGLDTPPYESHSGSPCCHGAYVPAYKCNCCHEYINTDTYVEINGDKYCEECFTIKNIGDIY